MDENVERPIRAARHKSGGAAAERDEPPVGGPGGDDMTDRDTSGRYESGRDDGTYEPPPREDDRAEVDSEDGRGPVIIRGGRYSGPQRGYYDPDPNAAPQARSDRGWRTAPPAYEQDDEAPPPRGPPPDSSADEDPRYRY